MKFPDRLQHVRRWTDTETSSYCKFKVSYWSEPFDTEICSCCKAKVNCWSEPLRQGSERAVLQLNWLSMQTGPGHFHSQNQVYAWYLKSIWRVQHMQQSQLTLQTQHNTTPSFVKHGSSFLCNLASNQFITKMLFFICQVNITCIPKTKYSISTKANNLVTETICLIFLSKHSRQLLHGFSSFTSMKKGR